MGVLRVVLRVVACLVVRLILERKGGLKRKGGGLLPGFGRGKVCLRREG